MKTLLKSACALLAVLASCELPQSNTTESRIAIQTMDNQVVASLAVTDQNVAVEYNEQNLSGVLKKEKRKYYNGGTLRYVIKFGDNGFKLRDHNEQLLWKVKLYDDKIKVSNNEEMAGAYEVKLRDGGKIKLERNDTTLKEFHLTDDKENWTTVDDRYRIKGFGTSLAAGTLLITDIPEEQRVILTGELLAAGR